MKPKHLAIAIVFTSCAIGFTSCKKTDNAGNSKDEIEATLELGTDLAIADNLTEDANDIFMEAATDNNLAGKKPVGVSETMGILGCATVTITPLISFPKNIAIDFGSGCTAPNGITRKGKIKIILSDSVRKAGSTAVLTFDGYFVNGFKKEGVITWTNTSTGQVKGWQRKVENGKITNPAGKYWLHSGVKEVVQVEGWATPRNLLDDVFSITGNHTVTNSNGVSRTSEIMEALQKKTICENISKGKIKLQGPNHNAVIDFGDGACDKIATISIDGGSPTTFLLR
ncbi:MAG: hypothetical protein ABIN67_17120 [Ferruginibacter sp.]